MRVLISGAAGNLGGMLARHLLEDGFDLTLMWHRRPLAPDLVRDRKSMRCSRIWPHPHTLGPAMAGVDAAVHLAGRLFVSRPSTFLAQTNIAYLHNLTQAARQAGVGRLVFVSFPQVVGPTTPDHPEMGQLDGRPVSLHALTRLEAEKNLLAAGGPGFEAVVIRSGTVYGPGVKLIESARWLLTHGLMAVWPQPTWFHLISITDFVRGLANAVRLPGLAGIYPLGDDQPETLQACLDRLADHWGTRRAWRLPGPAFMAAAWAAEAAAWALHTPAPLTRDLMRLAQVDHAMDTRRMKAELLPELAYPNSLSRVWHSCEKHHKVDRRGFRGSGRSGC